MKTVACAMNIYSDNNALPGALENAAQWADNIYVIHAGPGGKASNDGTMETLEKWGIKPVMADIMEGFGVIRTRLIRECGCDWAVIMDADERYMMNGKVLRPVGNDRFPNTLNPQNSVEVVDHSYTHWRLLKGLMNDLGDDFNAIRTCRRAWMDMSFTRPAQNWAQHPDWQLRIVRNNGHIGYTTDVRIHERIVDFRTGKEPQYLRMDDTERGLFVEHLHNFFKPMELAQNQEDLEIYESLQGGVTANMWLSHQPKS